MTNYEKSIMAIVAIKSAIADLPEKPRYKAERDRLGITLNAAIASTIDKFNVTAEKLNEDIAAF